MCWRALVNEASTGQCVADDFHAAPTPPKNGAMFNATSVALPRIFLRLTPSRPPKRRYIKRHFRRITHLGLRNHLIGLHH
jgi:hypothetical protein